MSQGKGIWTKRRARMEPSPDPFKYFSSYFDILQCWKKSVVADEERPVNPEGSPERWPMVNLEVLPLDVPRLVSCCLSTSAERPLLLLLPIMLPTGRGELVTIRSLRVTVRCGSRALGPLLFLLLPVAQLQHNRGERFEMLGCVDRMRRKR